MAVKSRPEKSNFGKRVIGGILVRTEKPVRDARLGLAVEASTDRQDMRSARAALTAGLAWNAPSTWTEATAARASSGVTS